MNPTKTVFCRLVTTLAVLLVSSWVLVNAVSFNMGGPVFKDARDLNVWAEQHGFFCRSDREDGEVVHALGVSTHAMTWEEMNSLCLHTLRPHCEWNGVIWAVNIYSQFGTLSHVPWSGEVRIWGNIIVTGDRALLDRIEQERR
jgi:hypothetical protein